MDPLNISTVTNRLGNKIASDRGLLATYVYCEHGEWKATGNFTARPDGIPFHTFRGEDWTLDMFIEWATDRYMESPVMVRSDCVKIGEQVYAAYAKMKGMEVQ